MSSDERNFTVWGFIKGFGKLLIGFLLIVQGLIGLVVMLMLVGLFVSISSGVAGGDARQAASIPKEAALLINPNGVLVEQAEVVDPFEQAIEDIYGVDDPGQVEVHGIVRALREAAEDERITGVVLDLGQLYISPYDASKTHYIAAEIEKFKTASGGKPVYAVGDYYGQEQYLIAARADKVLLHDHGSLALIGYGRYGTYFRSFLERLMITPHIFRVGTFKSAVEPFLRDDMSPEAKEANIAFLGSLWEKYAASIEEARGLQSGAVDRFAREYNDLLRAAGGDFAKAAFDYGLVDGLVSRPGQKAALVEAFGADKEGESFKHVNYRRYLLAVGEEEDTDAPNVAVVTAAGAIVDGDAPAGAAAGGDTIAGFLERARKDEDVKAVVLRVDSPGGSAFASEIIRDQVLALKEAGKPVVVSMGSLAASGGYWISAPGDEIWAAPSTITGSIGIFGLLLTFEEAAEYWGVNVDGVGTTPLTSVFATGLGPLEDNVADIIQQSVEDGYEDFLNVVAEGRNLDPAYVDSIGQGRVWIGDAAQGLKLVDNLGGIDEAVAAAARLAELETYDRVDIEEKPTPFDVLLSNLAAKGMAFAGFEEDRVRASRPLVARIVRALDDKVRMLEEYNDPTATYARCIACVR